MDIKYIKESVITEDGQILTGDSKRIEKYGKIIEIRQVNFYYEWPKFSYLLGKFCATYYNFLENVSMEPKNEDQIKEFLKAIKLTMKTDKKAFNAIVKMCQFVKVNAFLKLRWMKNNFSIDDWLELFLWIYYFNVAGEKKNSLSVLRAILKAR